MLDLKVKNNLLKSPETLTQVLTVEEGSDLRFFEIIKSEGKYWLRTFTENENKVSELEYDPPYFLESFLKLEGVPESLGINFKCSKDAAMVIFALAELKKRLHLDSLLHGTKELDVLSASESAIKEIKDLAFKESNDFRMPLGLWQMYLGENEKPDLEAAFKELKEKGFIQENGLLAVGALALITSLANIHASLALDDYKEGKDGNVLTKALYLNCYHSLWLVCPPDEKNEALFCTISLEEFRKDLKALF